MGSALCTGMGIALSNTAHLVCSPDRPSGAERFLPDWRTETVNTLAHGILVDYAFDRFPILADVLRELDPEGVSIPYLVSGGTDGRHFAQLGIRTYGFTPVTLPDGFDGWATIHDADERIPAAALDFGTEAIFRALQRL